MVIPGISIAFARPFPKHVIHLVFLRSLWTGFGCGTILRREGVGMYPMRAIGACARLSGNATGLRLRRRVSARDFEHGNGLPVQQLQCEGGGRCASGRTESRLSAMPEASECAFVVESGHGAGGRRVVEERAPDADARGNRVPQRRSQRFARRMKLAAPRSGRSQDRPRNAEPLGYAA